MNYIVAGVHGNNRVVFNRVIKNFPGSWYFIGDRSDLSISKLDRISPKYIFFLHWNWVVPKEIVDEYECVCFHMTDVPFGRGGSPLQNLIIRGFTKTKLSALKMVYGIDSGPVYMKMDMSLSGNADQIYLRASYLSAQMIKEIILNNPTPVPQDGKVVLFKRRTPSQSKIGKLNSIPKLYDHIRMLDADGYPRAFINYRGFRYEFDSARLDEKGIVARVKITKEKP